MPNADLTKILQVVSLAGAAFLALRLLITGLWRHYPIFFWYLLFRIPNTLWTLLIKNPSKTYEHVWISTEPLSWLFHVLVVVELYQLILKGHRGIYSLLRWAMYGSVAIAITISVISLLPHIKPHANLNSRLLGYWFATQRGIDFALAIFLLLILFFLSRYPVKLSRNLLLHAALYTVFFIGGALTMFLHTLFGGSGTKTTNLILEFITTGCIFAWVIFLTPAGEKIKASFPSLSPQREKHALRQLESLNATLLKVAHK